MAPDKFSFSLTRQKVATVTPTMCSVSEVFDDEIDNIKSRLFKTINNIVVSCQLINIDYFDLVTSVIYLPKINESSYSFEKTDNIGSSFLKRMDFQSLGAQELTTGIHFFFKRDRRSYTLKIEPFSGHPGEIFIDLIVYFPQESVSIAEIKMLIESELNYLQNDIFRFISSQIEVK
jgi:hypothetical protein